MNNFLKLAYEAGAQQALIDAGLTKLSSVPKGLTEAYFRSSLKPRGILTAEQKYIRARELAKYHGDRQAFYGGGVEGVKGHNQKRQADRLLEQLR